MDWADFSKKLWNLGLVVMDEWMGERVMEQLADKGSCVEAKLVPTLTRNGRKQEVCQCGVIMTVEFYRGRGVTL